MSYFKELKKEAMVSDKVIRGNIIVKRTKQTCSRDLMCLAVFLFISAVFVFACPVYAGTYLNSAHGNTTYGVKRSASGFPSDYTRGHCAHCHEQHAKIGGIEPDPDDPEGPDNYSLFYANHTSQTDNFCFECHTGVSSYQTGGSIVNRSYSYRAGAWTSDSVNDIKEMFSYTSPGTSHDLDDISDFIAGKWGYTSDSNPCNACHSPHAAQGDPIGAGSSTKSSGTRGYPLSLPTQHNSKDITAWGLYGDDASERMDKYSYQAPERYTSNLEPQGDTDTATAAQNTTDFVTFCTACHNTTYTITSTRLGVLTQIDWADDKHGARNRGENGDTYDKGALKAPYNDASDYVLSCLDCHEPHGSPNAYLLRKEVNGVVLSNAIADGDNSNSAWTEFCSACHDVTVTGTGDACEPSLHGSSPGGDWTKGYCYDCHGHGSALCPRTAGVNETF